MLPQFPLSSSSLRDDHSPLTPFGQFLVNLDDIPTSNHRVQAQQGQGMLSMFPPVEEEMSWDNSTTPPALRKLTDEEADSELNSALVHTNLYHDEDGSDSDNLTSVTSDDVFFDGSILEVSIGGKRKFSRSNLYRREVNQRKNVDTDTSEDDANIADKRQNELQVEVESELVEENLQRPRRNIERIDYDLLHNKGRKKKKEN